MGVERAADSGFRLAELLGSLSLATDLADGFSLEKSLRTALVAVRLARLVSTDPAVHRDAFWSSALRFLGCTAFAHEESSEFSEGDDLGLRRTLAFVDFGRPSTFVAKALGGIATHAPWSRRARALGRLVGKPDSPRRHATAQCEVGSQLALSLGFPEVAQVLALRDERWDGRGPRRTAERTTLPLAARLADVADTAELFVWHFGLEAALGELRARRGGQLEPRLVDAFASHAVELFDGFDAPSVWEAFLEAEPTPHRHAESSAEVARALAAFGRFADVGSVYLLDHSSRVAALANQAAQAAGLSAPDTELVTNAAAVHDLGRVAVPNGIWEKPGPLTPFERDRARSHAVATQTILGLAPNLAALCEVASAAHERPAGHGYHRRLRLELEGVPARLLASADVAVALTSTRPHRPAFTVEQARRHLRDEVHRGALDGVATGAVLEALGQAPRRTAWPRGLSDREVEVVRLVAVGRTNKEIGALLGMSGRTAQKHVMHVYEKVGCESRAALALFASENGLLVG